MCRRLSAREWCLAHAELFCAQGALKMVTIRRGRSSTKYARSPSWRSLVILNAGSSTSSRQPSLVFFGKPRMIGLAPHFCRPYYHSPRRVGMVYPFRRARCGIFPACAPKLPLHGVMCYIAAVVSVAVYRSASRASRPPTTRRSVWSYLTPFR